MMLFRTLFRVFFKWLFGILSGLAGTEQPYKANGRQNGQVHHQRGEKYAADVDPMDEYADRALGEIKRAMSQFEQNLTRKVEQLENGAATATVDRDLMELNELRADLAELKADIRSLKRMMVSTEKSHGDDEPHVR